jgi:DNA-binding Lrp family transcriptional regulator
MAGRKPDVSDDEIISVLEGATDPVLSTNEVAEELPIKSNGTQRRLKELYKEGEILGKKAGNSWIWWLPDD